MWIACWLPILYQEWQSSRLFCTASQKLQYAQWAEFCSWQTNRLPQIFLYHFLDPAHAMHHVYPLSILRVGITLHLSLQHLYCPVCYHMIGLPIYTVRLIWHSLNPSQATRLCYRGCWCYNGISGGSWPIVLKDKADVGTVLSIRKSFRDTCYCHRIFHGSSYMPFSRITIPRKFRYNSVTI